MISFDEELVSGFNLDYSTHPYKYFNKILEKFFEVLEFMPSNGAGFETT
jgi:hypothetical protein